MKGGGHCTGAKGGCVSSTGHSPVRARGAHFRAALFSAPHGLPPLESFTVRIADSPPVVDLQNSPPMLGLRSSCLTFPQPICMPLNLHNTCPEWVN